MFNGYCLKSIRIKLTGNPDKHHQCFQNFNKTICHNSHIRSDSLVLWIGAFPRLSFKSFYIKVILIYLKGCNIILVHLSSLQQLEIISHRLHMNIMAKIINYYFDYYLEYKKPIQRWLLQMEDVLKLVVRPDCQLDNSVPTFSLHTRTAMHYHIPVTRTFGSKFLACPHSSIWRVAWSTPENENLVRTWHLGFELVWSTLSLENENLIRTWLLWIWVGLEYPQDLFGSWCVETNRCIPQGYRLVLLCKK